MTPHSTDPTVRPGIHDREFWVMLGRRLRAEAQGSGGEVDQELADIWEALERWPKVRALIWEALELEKKQT